MASRRHWRFIVRDAYGKAIQNAHVNVYQPGTTNAFSGTAYNAYTGGSTVTNPFTTNAQGEVEAYFDTAQDVDVAVDSNSSTAYLAVDPTTTVTFTPFTERDEVRVDVADSPSAVGVAGDLVVAYVNPFTAVTAAAGTTTRWADAGHTHPFTALTPAAASGGLTTATAGTSTNPARADHQHPLWAGTTRPSPVTQLALTNSTTETAIATLTMPANSATAGSAFDIKVPMYVTNSAAGAVTLTFRVRWGGVAGVVLGGALAITVRASLGSDIGALLEGVATIRTIGGTGTAVADLVLHDKITSATFNISNSVVTAAATIDTTVSKDLVITAAWTAAAATSTLKVDNAYIQQVV